MLKPVHINLWPEEGRRKKKTSSRWDTEAFLDRHNARLPYTRRMLEEDRRNLAKVFRSQ